MRKTVTTKLIKEFEKMHCQGYSAPEIGNKFGLSGEAVNRYLRKAGYDLQIGRRKSKYYKDKYCIALYDEDGCLFRLFDNPYQMADFFETTPISCFGMITERRINGKLRYKGKWYRKALIEI